MLYLHMSVWCTDGRKWKTWLLTARLCSNLKGSRTTPSRTGNVKRSSSLWLAESLNNSNNQIITHFFKPIGFLFLFFSLGPFRLPGGGGRAVIFGLMSGGKGGFTSWFGDRYGGMLLPGVIGGVGLPGTGE